MFRKLRIIVYLMGIVLICSGCFSAPQNSFDKNMRRVVFVSPQKELPVWLQAKSGFMDAAEDYGFQAEWLGSEDCDLDEMTRQISIAIAEDVDAIVTCPLTPSVFDQVFSQAKEKDIPVITVAVDASSPQLRSAFISPDYQEIGYNQAVALHEAVGGPMKQQSIQKQLTCLALAAVIVMGFFAAAVVFGWSQSARQYSAIVAQSSAFTELSNGINQAYVDLDCYIQSPDHESLEKYNLSMQYATEAVADIKRDTEVQDIYYSVVGIENMLQEADRINMEIIDQLDLNSFNDIYALFSESQTLLTYVNLRVAAVTAMQNEWMQQQLTSITEWVQRLVFLLIPLLILIFCALLFFSLWIARRIIASIRLISAQANQLAAGDLSVEDIPKQSLLEFSMIAESLNKMKSELSIMIEKIREQSNIAAKLHETELENLRISNDLKNTELRVMQAQVNPHFLYNTLNSIGRLAYSAGDTQVVKLIEALSDMLRYNLNHIERSITLQEELENLKNYMYIQETRFGDKLAFQIRCHSQRMHLEMPCLTLQPIVENAIVHGLSPYNYEGSIEVDIRDEEQWTLVSIHDDGVGMESSDIEKMVSGAFEASYRSVKHTSIGFCNVKTRLNSFFDKQDCVTVHSEVGEGTTVVLKLYCEKGHQNV